VWDLRTEALDEARTLDPQTIGPELRQALVATLARENAREQARYEAYKDREVADNRGDTEAEFRFRTIGAVIRLRDPNTIPVLVQSLGTGNAVINALVQFGDVAAPAVLAVARSDKARGEAIDDALRTLTRMVQAAKLRPSTIQTVRLVAGERLAGTQAYTVVLNTIELAEALGAPELLGRVEQLANDPTALQGFDPDDQRMLRKAAAEALATRKKK